VLWTPKRSSGPPRSGRHVGVDGFGLGVGPSAGRAAGIGSDGAVIDEWTREMPSADHYGALLRNNYIGMAATVVFRRSVLRDVGGFDTRLAACEDYELYLRITRRHTVGCHGDASFRSCLTGGRCPG